MKKAIGIGFALGLLLGAARSALAEETPTTCPICQAANDETAAYFQKAGSTLMRGVLNTAFGWTELLVRPTEEVQEGGNLATGIGKGVGFAAKRTFLGFGELLTFWAPKSQGGYLRLNKDCPSCMGKLPRPQPSHQAVDKSP